MLEQLLAEKIGKLEIELAQYKVAYNQINEENTELRKIKKVLDENAELKELFEEALKNVSENR